MFQIHKELIEEKFNKHKVSFEQYVKNFEFKIIKHSKRKLEFDLINVDCSIANALRRILIAEVPTMAIDNVIVHNYFGIMPEENLAHRLGLLPIHIDSTFFQFSDGEVNEKSGLKFTLKKRNVEDNIMIVYSNDIQWVPIGNQANLIQPPKIQKNIAITKLSKNHEIDIEMIAVKGTGKEHAKWSPVSLSTYRLFPVIEIKDIYDEEAEKLKNCFSPGVIEIKKCEQTNLKKAHVSDPRSDTMSREALRHPEFSNKVFIGKKNNHFIFTIESIYVDPLILLQQSILILKAKTHAIKEELSQLTSD